MLYAGLDLSRKRLDFHLLAAEGATVDVGALPPPHPREARPPRRQPAQPPRPRLARLPQRHRWPCGGTPAPPSGTPRMTSSLLAKVEVRISGASARKSVV
jgi:hypothetical protein